MDKVRLGTIGSGVIAHSVLDAVKVTDGVELVAVYSRTSEKAEEMANEYGAAFTYTDLQEFFNSPEINTVYIASPNNLHYIQAKAALLAGKNVICEKPFCTKEAEAIELANIAEDCKLMLLEAAPTSYLPNFKILKERLSEIGRIRVITSNYSQYSSRYDALLSGQLPNVFNPEYAGGCLMDINFYNVYLNIALFGLPENVSYYPNTFQLPDGKGVTDTSGIVILKYGDFISTNVGAKDTFGVNYFQIEGEKGYIYIAEGSNGLKEIRLVTKDKDETFNEQDNLDRWFYEIQAIVPMMLSEKYDEVKNRFRITLETIRVMESARKAAGILYPGD